MTRPDNPRWSELLIEAVERPGLILEAYSRFHGYSLGNQIAAICQCIGRGIPPGPIATVTRWNDLGRRVKKGERALCLCMPVTVKERSEGTVEAEKAVVDDATPRLRTAFVWKRRWFVLAQTEGEALPDDSRIPSWDKTRALEALGIREIPFAEVDGNVQGYAKGRSVAVNPLAQLPLKTLFHECGHALLGHSLQVGGDRIVLPASLAEAEAESVALLCLEALRLPGAEYCRGYIQDWLGRGVAIPDPSAQRIFKVANQILRAGSEQTGPSPAPVSVSAAA